MVISTEFSVFLELVSTGYQGHTDQWISDNVSQVFSTHDSTTFYGVVTENTSANKLARKLLKQSFPSLFFQGCPPHSLNLLVKYIFNARNTNVGGSNEDTHPLGYPFEYLLPFIVGYKETAKFFHCHHVMKEQLRQAQELAKLIVLVRPVPNQWGNIQAMCASLLES